MRREEGTPQRQAFNHWVHTHLGADHLGDHIRFIGSYCKTNTRIQPQTSYFREEGGWKATIYPFCIESGSNTVTNVACPAGVIFQMSRCFSPLNKAPMNVE
eukprot:4346531-Ditylum_brightwellii.AAC.1